MKTYLVFLTVAAALVLVACSSKKEKGEDSNYLVLYYSQTGVTKAVAEEIQHKLSAVIEEIEVNEPYDGDYQQTIERCQQEMADSIIPDIKPIKANLDDYDVIFLGYPVWFGTYARPIMGLLKEYDFSGKKIVPFCTFGSGGLESSVANLKEALPKAEVTDGFGIREARMSSMPDELERFLKEEGFIGGGVEKLADYSEQQPVTADETAIFEAACCGYRFPLGTPVSVGKRTTPYGTDYKYMVKSKMGDGEEMDVIIYVTVSNKPDSAPEFTRVVR